MDLKYRLYDIIFSNTVYNLFIRPFDRLLYPVVETGRLMEIRKNNPVPLNKCANAADMANPAWNHVLENMSGLIHMDFPSFHRKNWEYVHTIYVLKEKGLLLPENTGLAIGAGRESILYYLAHKVKKITGIDLYDGHYLGGEDEPDIPQNPEKYAPFLYPMEKLSLQKMDSRKLNFRDESFDFAFSCSSIEHFGSLSDIETALKEIYRVLKPGGGCVITTELKLNRLGTRIPDTRIFTLSGLNDLIRKAGFIFSITETDIQIEKELLKKWIVLPNGLPGRPHGILRFFHSIFTSVLLILEKPGNRVRKGNWQEHIHVSPFEYRGDIQFVLDRNSFKKKDMSKVDITLKNTGNFDWYTQGYSHRIAIGIQLREENGKVIDQNFSDLAIPAIIRKGEEFRFNGTFPIRRRPGKYQLLFDLKQERITWFSSRGNTPFIIPITIN
jgi:SAM-dependent methyltransferase